jgi:hypothetical protein
MVAFASGERRRWPSSWIFVLHETSDSTPSITAFPVSQRQEGEAGTTNANRTFPQELELGLLGDSEINVPPTRPCESWSAFFLKGVGELPGNPVVLYRWENDGPSRSILVDPARHILVMRPVLRFSTRDVKDLRNRKATFLLGITLTAGRNPFVLLGLLRRPDGTYSEAAFVPKAEEQGWSAFVHTPEETTEISFYALDDPPAFHSVCRTQLSSREEP